MLGASGPVGGGQSESVGDRRHQQTRRLQVPSNRFPGSNSSRVIEILDYTAEARRSIEAVKPWRA